MRIFWMVSAILLATVLGASAADKYNGPVPEKANIPYLLHADNLIELEEQTASESTKGDKLTYVIKSATSPAQTPMSEPMFLLKTQSDPSKLSLYPFDSKGGSREITFNTKKPKDNPRPVRFSITKLMDGLYKLEVQQFMENGEYAFSPDGSNLVFAFQVY